VPRLLGCCGQPVPAEKGTTSTAIGPDGTLRECCDGDGLGTSSLTASREGEAQVRLAGLGLALEGAARVGRVDVVITRSGGGRPGVAAAGTWETLAAAIAAALAPGADA
jgi:hypothetical protein